MMPKQQDTKKPSPSPLKFLAIIAAGVFFVELGIMLVFEYWLPPSYLLDNFIDALILLIILFPILYYFSFRPLTQNISERKRFESRLEEANIDLQKFKSAIQNVSDHIIITDSEGEIAYANPAAEKITGYKFEEMKGSTPRLWGRQMPLEFYKKMWHIIKEEKKVFAGEVTNKRKSGELYQAVISISPVLDGSGRLIFFAGVERDITKEKEVDRSKSEFVSLASHQLRTPLSAVNWYAEMLMDEDVGKLNKKQKDYLLEIYHSSKRMSDLVGALLNVSRIEMGTFAVEPEPTDVVEIAESVIKEIAHEVKKRKQEITEEYGKDIGLINVDRNLTELVIQNLVSNAVKYTQNGGSIGLSITKNPDVVLIAVSDNGYGIPEAQKDRVFQKFFRADNVREKETDGTGLGLYMVKEIVEHSGGKIWFQSQENKGSTFYVSVPLSGMTKKEGSKKLVQKSR